MRIAYLFPGQGSQSVGMGRDLYDEVPAARELYDQADEILGFSLSQLCFEGPEETLTNTVNQQPALYVTCLAILAAMRTDGWPTAAFVAGHSLGELAALTAAGSLDFKDGLRLVRRRGELMALADQRAPGSMAAILGLDIPTITAKCEEAATETGLFVHVANDNCPGQAVISGDQQALQRAAELLQEAGARKVVHLPITIAAHSPLMASVNEEFAAAVDQTPISDPDLPVIANTTARPLTTAAAVQAELKAQLTGPVRWTPSMTYLVEQGVTEIVEVGPDDTLRKLMRRIDRSVKRTSYQRSP